MNLVVDANVLFSSIVKDSLTRKLLCNPKAILYAPEFVILELNEHKDEILTKSKISEEDFNNLISVLLSRINIISEFEIKPYLKESEKISPDKNDVPYIALCLAMNIPLWSNDKILKRQTKVKIFSTEELMKILK